MLVPVVEPAGVHERCVETVCVSEVTWKSVAPSKSCVSGSDKSKSSPDGLQGKEQLLLMALLKSGAIL